MGYLIVIGIAALATGLSSIYEIFIPVFRKLKQEDPNNIMLENIWLSYITCFFLAVLTFPLMIFAILFSSEHFINKLVTTFKDIKIQT